MNLYIRQRVLALTDTFDVYNEAGQSVYRVQNELFRIAHRLTVCDMAGRELALVKQRFFTLLPAFELYTGGVLRATMHKELTLFSPRYYFDGLDWALEGDFFSHSYRMADGSGRELMRLEKAYFTFSDSYELSVAPGADPLFCLLTVLAIDAANCGN